MQKKTTRNKRKSKGLGDTIEKFTEVTGIKAAVKFILGEDCKCDERKEILNRLFPYKKDNCLSENHYAYLQHFFSQTKSTLSVLEQRELTSIYNATFNVNLAATSCDSCWRDYIADLRKVYNEY